MFTIRPLPEFDEWLAGLKDGRVRGAVTARIVRLAAGLPGDTESVGDGVTELRIHLGAGWRVYYVQRGAIFIVLLCGGSKSTQRRDIQRARTLAARLDWPED